MVSVAAGEEWTKPVANETSDPASGPIAAEEAVSESESGMDDPSTVIDEGPEDAIAAEITDILPEGLEFVSGHSANSIWTYNSATRKIVTNNNYKPAAIKGHVSGKDLFYVDISVVCRVSSTAKTGTDLKNVAEITKMTDKDGNKVTDRDSTPGNYNPNGKYYNFYKHHNIVYY